ncbi:MAG TPA: amidase family protein, partial [Candidatus Binataceae bacterium]|nr:amidase family protein [Candidatus Binataceae bacterium]
AALMLGVIAGHDRNDATSSRERVPDYTEHLNAGISGMKIGVIRELTDNLSSEVRTSFLNAQAALRTLGATVEEVSMPSLPLAGFVNSAIVRAEAFEYHESWLLERRQDYGDDVRRLIESGMLATGASYVRAQRARPRMVAEALAALNGRDVLIAPGAAIPAYRIGMAQSIDEPEGTVDPLAAILRFTMPFDVTGQPALALPIGLSPDGLPLSMQIIGRPFDEARVLQVGAAYERARDPLPAPTAI